MDFEDLLLVEFSYYKGESFLKGKFAIKCLLTDREEILKFLISKIEKITDIDRMGSIVYEKISFIK